VGSYGGAPLARRPGFTLQRGGIYLRSAKQKKRIAGVANAEWEYIAGRRRFRRPIDPENCRAGTATPVRSGW